MSKNKITWLDILYGFTSVEGAILILIIIALIFT
jgi:hypothetical protein